MRIFLERRPPCAGRQPKVGRAEFGQLNSKTTTLGPPPTRGFWTVDGGHTVLLLRSGFPRRIVEIRVRDVLQRQDVVKVVHPVLLIELGKLGTG